MNRCKRAKALLDQTMREYNADVVLISEPGRNPGDWIMDTGGKAAIWITGLNCLKHYEDRIVTNPSFAATNIGNITIMSIYLSPGISIAEYAFQVKEIVTYIIQQKRAGQSIVVGGDWNARSPAWGSDILNHKGSIVLENLLKYNIFPIKPTGGYTFERRNQGSNIDFVATSTDLQKDESILSTVLDIETFSDHNYILTTISQNINRSSNINSRMNKWKLTQKNKLNFQLTFAVEQSSCTKRIRAQ